jgi:hypothetical protein
MDQVHRQPTQADVDLAARLLGNGSSPDEVRLKLADRGLDQTTAAAVVHNAEVRGVYADAAQMLNNDVPPEDAEQHLVNIGVDPKLAKTVVENLVAKAQVRLQQAEDRHPPTHFARLLVGGLVFAVGLILFTGNITGTFRTIPFAGYIVMAIGAIIARFGGGSRSEGSPLRLAVCIAALAIFVAGLALYLWQLFQ